MRTATDSRPGFLPVAALNRPSRENTLLTDSLLENVEIHPLPTVHHHHCCCTEPTPKKKIHRKCAYGRLLPNTLWTSTHISTPFTTITAAKKNKKSKLLQKLSAIDFLAVVQCYWPPPRTTFLRPQSTNIMPSL